jgi:hypothetical protein
MKFYKIRNKRTGLFSTGGVWPNWSRLGRTFNTIGHVRQHLSSYNCGNRMKETYENAEIVELETVENWTIEVDRFVKSGTSFTL